jgi:hypothetical protein
MHGTMNLKGTLTLVHAKLQIDYYVNIDYLQYELVQFSAKSTSSA